MINKSFVSILKVDSICLKTDAFIHLYFMYFSLVFKNENINTKLHYLYYYYLSFTITVLTFEIYELTACIE